MSRSSAVRALIVALLAVLTSSWMSAQPKSVTGTFGQTGANQAYIVVNKPTTVLFTTRITDRQLKKHSIVLIRLDAEGKYR